MHFIGEFFKAQTGFMKGACRNSRKVLPDERKNRKHGKSLQGHDNFTAGPFLNGIEDNQIPLQGCFVNDVTGSFNVGYIDIHLLFPL